MAIATNCTDRIGLACENPLNGMDRQTNKPNVMHTLLYILTQNRDKIIASARTHTKCIIFIITLLKSHANWVWSLTLSMARNHEGVNMAPINGRHWLLCVFVEFLFIF